MIDKNELNKLVKKYETIDFIKDDPIQFPHRYSNKKEIELAGFISSLFAYGNRKMFIKKLNELFDKTQGDLLGFVRNGDFSSLSGIEYRFSKEDDIIEILKILSKLYNESTGLEELFTYSSTLCRDENKVFNSLQNVVNYFYNNITTRVGQGFYHMLPNPQNGGAMKRMNMFLRWMVRKSCVDFGIWNCFEPKDLLIPLDVHVARISRNMGLLTRKSNDAKAVIELTNKLKSYSPTDPIKYDFAMFAFGIELNKANMKN